MFKIYQKSWHSIQFIELNNKLSKHNLPEDSFYKEFYKIFNKRYKKWEDLNPNWLSLKVGVADKLASHLSSSKKVSILSLGAGIGVIEKRLFDIGYKNIFIQEVSEVATLYSKEFIKKENIFIGNFPECINSEHIFDYIILGNIEYLFKDNELIDLIIKARQFMHERSNLILLSSSIEKENIFSKSKILLKKLLIKLNLIDPGQFWGYGRTLKEINNLITNSGFKIKKSEIDNSTKPWITGFIEAKYDYKN